MKAKLIQVRNVTVYFQGQVGSGRTQVLQLVQEALLKAKASVNQHTEHSLTVNFIREKKDVRRKK